MRCPAQRPAIMVWILAGAAVAATLAADVLVLQDGQRITTDGPWEVRGRQIVYHTPGGVLTAVRASQVDLEASEAATRAANAPAQPQAGGEDEDKPQVRLVDVARANQQAPPPAAVIDPDRSPEQRSGLELDTAGLDSPTEQRLYRLGVRIGQKLVAIDREFDLSTPQGAQAAAADLRSLANEVRRSAEGEEGQVRSQLETLAARLEQLADLARDDPQQFVATIRAYARP